MLDMSIASRPMFPKQARAAKALGQRLRLARRRRRMTAEELAERAGVSRMTVYKLETGDTSVGLNVLIRVLNVLGLDGDLDLIAGEDPLGRRIQDAALPRPRRSIR
jgi:transcriptional regulator with XRE-family HTH domain